MLTRRNPEEMKNPRGDKSNPKESPCCGHHPTQEVQARTGKTRITIRYDVGFPNALYIRGKGAPGLSWDRGVQLKNIRPDTWIWETSETFATAEFKVLINDSLYEEGENRTLRYGSQIEYTPHFAHAKV